MAAAAAGRRRSGGDDVIQGALSDEDFARQLQEQLAMEESDREKRDRELAQQVHEEVTGTTATDFECVMCLEEFKGMRDLNKGVVTVCKHKFCMKCFLSYIESREQEIHRLCAKPRHHGEIDKDIKCPLCRTSILADGNRIRKIHSLPPVSIPSAAAQLRRATGPGGPGAPRLPWDPSNTIIVTCNRCQQRLFAPPGRHVKCVCGNVIAPQQQGAQRDSTWRNDNQVMVPSSLPQAQQSITLVLCPSCRTTFSARAGETVRCRCGTGLFVPKPDQAGGGGAAATARR